jgi:ribonuclease P protein component
MLPKRRRISRHIFPEGPGAGKVFHAPHLSLRMTPDATGQSRHSIVVSKKTARRAVDRHLIKRRVYESIARHDKAHTLPLGRYVFFAKKDVHTLPFRVLEDEVDLLLREASSIVKHTRLV